MSEQDTPWGEASFERDRNWYKYLPINDPWNGDEKALYAELRQKAHDDPEFDLFDEFMPTRRPKHDIGRYVMRHNVNVPLLNSMSEWQDALMTDTAMLRSESQQDYKGQGGLYSSHVFNLVRTYPLNEYGVPDDSREWSEDSQSYVMRRKYQGPENAEIGLGHIDMLNNSFSNANLLGSAAITGAVSKLLREGIFDGSVNPSVYMRLRYWEREHSEHMSEAQFHRYQHILSPDYVDVSRWRYIPGVNVRILRDNVIEGKYFLGGKEAHHHWEVADGIDSADVEAHTKAGYRGRVTEETHEYTLPTGKIIELYEKVRTLPYFDHRQTPLMEMQYGKDGELYFLQYLKTGNMLHTEPLFDLPTGKNIITANSVRGVTKPEGEKLRIYIDPKVFTRNMKGQSILADHNMQSRFSNIEQIASLMTQVMIVDSGLDFKDNHSNSAPLTRSPVVVSLWDEKGDAFEHFARLSNRPEREHQRSNGVVRYINAIITSNGVAATIDSDWQLKSEKIN